METFITERLMLDRHHAMARNADSRMRLEGWPLQDSLAETLAARLRLLADRLDGKTGSPTVVSESA